MKEKVCERCGQTIPQPEGRLICSSCGLAIKRGQGGWLHGGDGRPKHRDCKAAGAVSQLNELTMELLA